MGYRRTRRGRNRGAIFVALSAEGVSKSVIENID
jgi:hypothetical protein